MSDILSTRKLGDNSVTRPQVSSATTSAVGTVANLPTALNNAAVGTLIKALVAAQDAHGLTTVQTDKGTLVLQTSVPLKVGSEIVLQLQSTGTQNRFLILSVDHQPLSTNAKAPSTGGSISSAPTPSGGSPTHVAATGMTGERFAQAGRGPAVASTGPTTVSARALQSVFDVRGPLIPGLVVPARVIAGGNPGTLPMPMPSASASAGAATNPGPIGLVAGDVLTLRILGMTAPGGAATATPASSAAGSAPTILQATVTRAGGIPRDAKGGPSSIVPTEIRIGDARISIPVSPAPATGTQLEFELLDTMKRPAPMAGNASSYRDFLRLAVDWPSLKETTSLIRGDIPAAGNPATPFIPETGTRMASTLLFFMAALKSGNARAWLGEARVDQLLQTGHGNLLAQLGDDFALLARHAGDGLANGWHALAVPVDTGSHLEQLRLFYRRRGAKPDNGDDPAETTHFVVEADLSRVGLFRLEGMVRPRQFDLLVHSSQGLDGTMRDTIRSIFHDALNGGDLGGTLRFEAGPMIPFNPTGQTSADIGQAAGVIA